MVQQIQKYQRKLFPSLFEIKELEFVVKFLFNNHKDRLLKFTEHMTKENYEFYSKALDSWIVKFDKCYSKPWKTISSD